MLTHSESVAKIAAALVKVAAQIENPHKNARNPHFKNDYADLAEIVNTSRPVLAANGLTVVQCPGMDEGFLTVDSLLLHESGEWIRGVASSPLPKADPQGVGSATTYLRRYSLAALLGLAQEDDDGEAASRTRDKHTGEKNQSLRELAGEEPKGHTPTAERVNGKPNKGDPIPCPDCGGPMWDNREKKKSGNMQPKSPDLSCKDRTGCNKAIWLGGWRDTLLRRIATAHDMGELDAEERAKMEEAVNESDPALLYRVDRKLMELIPG